MQEIEKTFAFPVLKLPAKDIRKIKKLGVGNIPGPFYGQPVTYYHPSGHYICVANNTKEVIHISDRNQQLWWDTHRNQYVVPFTHNTTSTGDKCSVSWRIPTPTNY